MQTAPEQKIFPGMPDAKPEALVIWCGDPRFQEATLEFLTTLGMQPGTYFPLIMPGGIASLTDALFLPKESWFLRNAIKFYVGHFASIHKIVLINHEDCGKYHSLTKLLPNFPALQKVSTRQQSDLRKAVTGLRDVLPREVGVEGYYARFANGERTQIQFDTI